MKKLLIILLCLPMLVLAQKTYVPDDNFEQELINLGYDNVLDDSVFTANINTVTALGLNGINSSSISNISDITGIEGFSSLVDFSIVFTQISSINLSNNTALTDINCTGNQLTSIDVSGCVALTRFSCDQNQLTSLDVSQNTALVALACYYNQITSLDVSQNPVLINLACSHNNLSSLDARNGINFTYAFNASSNPNLTCIDVDDIAYATANYFIDPQTSFSLNCIVPGCTDSLACNYDYLATIDDSSCTYVNTSVSTSNISCYGYADGSVVATANGGISPYQYSLGGGLSQSSGTFSNLTAGTYFVDVTDINGCSANTSVTITEPTALNISVTTTDETSVLNDGSATAFVQGGTGTYTYLWGNGGTSNPQVNLTPGIYDVMVLDANGCTVSTLFTINAYTTTNIIDVGRNTIKKLSEITDMLGQEIPYRRKIPLLLYLYDDGTVEKKLIIE